MKQSSEMPQNLPYFWNKKMPWSMLSVDVDQGIYQGKNNVARNEKNYVGFVFQNMANFEAFRYTISLSINFLFLKSGTYQS